MVQRKRKTKAPGRKPAKGRASERRASIRFFLIWGPVILLVIICLYALAFDPGRPFGPPVAGVLAGTEQQGLALQASAKHSVTLEDGRQVEATLSQTPGSQPATLQKGQRVLVQENTTAIFRRRHFVILRTIE